MIDELQITKWRVRGSDVLYNTKEEAEQEEKVQFIRGVLKENEESFYDASDVEIIYILLTYFDITKKP